VVGNRLAEKESLTVQGRFLGYSRRCLRFLKYSMNLARALYSDLGMPIHLGVLFIYSR
jgi:hypothetical protein